MEALATYTQPLFSWLVETTLVAGLVICLILGAQRLLGGRLGPRGCHALWLVLLVRMVLPWAPPSPISLFKLIPSAIRPVVIEDEGIIEPYRDRPRATETTGSAQDRAVAGSEPTEPAEIPPALKPQAAVEAEPSSEPIASAIRSWLPVFWLAGAVVLGTYLFAGNFALWRIVKREHPLTRQSILELLEACKAQMDVQTIVALVPTDQVNSAALFGFVRPRLLLPRQMVETASQDELRYVFLHELAHLKRHDIYLGWLTSLLLVLHWFNPLVWLAFHRMRADRELACDALVLTRTGQDESHAYGRTMVGLLERFSRPRRLPAMAGILESKTELKRRITMIARFKNNSYRWSPLAVVLIMVVACLSLPDARRDIATAAESVASGASARPVFRRIQVSNKVPWDASLSPDGRTIAFVSEDKLWVMPRVGTLGQDYPGPARLVDTGAVKAAWAGLAWSGDGRWIAFNSMKEEPKGNVGTYIVSVEGGIPRAICENYRETRVFNYRISLSPDGKTLAFASVDGNELHIYTVAVDGGAPTRLVEATAREPVFSPDGTMIAYVEDKSLGRQGGSLWIVPAGGGTATRVAEATNATSPVWSPDGRMIAFLDYKDQMTTKHIHIVPIGKDGQGAGQKITIDCPQEVDEINRLTGWAADGKIGAIFKGHIEFGLYTFPATGGTATLVEHGTYAAQPRWSPDGKRIVFSTNAPGGDSGWATFGTASISADDGDVTAIAIPSDVRINKGGWGGGNHVSPDGRTIVFAGRQSAAGEGAYVRGRYTSHIWTLPLEGGKPVQITDAAAPLMDWFPCWSPDGKTIAFVRAKDNPNMAEAFKEANIFLVPTTGGETRQLTGESDAFMFGAIAWSPDGKSIAFFSGDRERSPDNMSLRVIPVEGGPSRLVGKVQAASVNTELAWSPDSKRIALNGPLYEKVIKIMSVADGSTVDIVPNLVEPSSIWHLDWSRDGRQFVFAGGQGTADPELWMMDNFLPAAVGLGLVSENNVFVDPQAKITFTKFKTLSGPACDAIQYSSRLHLSPNGRFLLRGVRVIPLDGGEPFDLVDMPSADNGSLSPDGRKVVFYASEAIWLIEVDPETGRPVGSARQLLDGERRSYPVRWSADSRTIIFSRREAQPGPASTWSVWTLGLQEGKPSPLADPSGCGLLSPDGKTLAWSESQGISQARPTDSLWVRPAAGGEPKKIVDYPRINCVVWSSNSEWVAVSNQDDCQGLRLVRIADGHEVWINAPDAGLVQQSPQGRKLLLYQSPYDTKEVMKVVSVAGGPPAEFGWPNLSFEPWWAGHQLWIRDSRNILVEAKRGEDEWNFWSVPLDGRAPRALTIDTPMCRDAYMRLFSPDGSKLLLFVGGYQGDWDLWTVPVSMTQMKSTGPPVKAFGPMTPPSRGAGLYVDTWSPDGTRIAFVHNWDIWVADADGKNAIQLTQTPEHDVWPVWSPDSTMIAFGTLSSSLQSGQVRVVSASGGEVKDVADLRFKETPLPGRPCAWLPNGREVTVICEVEGIIANFPIAGGEPKTVARFQDLGIDRANWQQWSPDGRFLAFQGKTGQEGLKLYVYQPDTAKLQRLADDDDVFLFYWSPDSRWISYFSSQLVKTRPEGILWEMDVDEAAVKLAAQE
jgi:Tol biopolymer transport system component/beta-lactamase regulating signal transducer with metallopeptidase domain